MSEENHKQAVPVYVWILSVLLAIVFLAGGFAFYGLQQLDRKEKDVGQAQSDIIYSNLEPGQTAEVMIFGSSLIKCAFTRFGSLDNVMHEKGKSFAYEVITRNSVELDEYSEHIEEIRKKKPGFVFLESNMTCVQMFKEKKVRSYSFNSIYERYVSGLESAPKFFSFHIWRTADNLSLPVPPQRLKNKEEYWKKYAKQVQRFRVRSINDFPEWNTFFEEAKDLGIQVYIIEVTRSLDAKKLLPEGFQEDYEALLQQYEDLYGVKFVKYPDEMEQESNYRDAAHLNRRGAAIYSAWFVDLMTDLLNEDAD